MRLRTAQNKLKIEHSIIDGVRDVLERLLADNTEVRSVIPGVIRPVRDAKGEVKVRITVPTTNGWKAIALSAGARQELFISTAWSKEELERAIARAGSPRSTISPRRARPTAPSPTTVCSALSFTGLTNQFDSRVRPPAGRTGPPYVREPHRAVA